MDVAAGSESAVDTRPTSVQPTGLAAIADQVGGSSVRGRSLDAVAVTGLSLSSGGVRPGDLYAALAGARTHGARFVPEAVTAGAVAVLTDQEGAALCADVDVPLVVTDAPRARLGDLAATIYGRPAESLTLVGVTGTQGKTTTTQLISRAVAQSGRRTAVVGTMGTWIDGHRVGSALTTPEAPDLHALFAVMREREVELCAIEVSSHALVMGRVDGVVFDLAVFTNLGRDHLDFHVDMEDYFGAKAQLFTPQRAKRGLVNLDDEYGRRLSADARIPMETMSATGRPATWRATMDVEHSTPGATAFEIVAPDGTSHRAAVQMPGDFNVANGLAAVAACVEAGVSVDAAVQGVGVAPPVGGRMERVVADGSGGPGVIIDYAHKPDALTAALGALRPVTPGRLFLVIGAGGDRDRGKRPLMGEIGAQLADVLVVTDDNPRSEAPATIRAEILAGAERAADGHAEVVEIGDRRAAIRYAVLNAAAEDAVLVAGKGHETGQEIEGSIYPFDDKVEATEALRLARTRPDDEPEETR
jgi:UDP-N-acetylmuramoyl-L-alanyl-D-glutamate--2,6-diaminopimelate ligase